MRYKNPSICWFSFVFPEWVHSSPHSRSLWKHQCSYTAVESGCCCGLHCKGKCEILVMFSLLNYHSETLFSTKVWKGTLLLPAKGPGLTGLVSLSYGAKGVSLCC